jgi:hypothetical protein
MNGKHGAFADKAPMRHFPLRELGYAIGFIIVLAALYVGSYYAMVLKSGGPSGHDEMIRVPDSPFAFPIYRLNEEWVYGFYAPMYAIDAPMYAIDLKVRPDFWLPAR